MAGTLDLLQRGATGLEARGDVLHLDPIALPEFDRFRVRLRYRQHWGVVLTHRAGRLRIAVPPGGGTPLRVAVRGREHTVPSDHELVLDPEPD